MLPTKAYSQCAISDIPRTGPVSDMPIEEHPLLAHRPYGSRRVPYGLEGPERRSAFDLSNAGRMCDQR